MSKPDVVVVNANFALGSWCAGDVIVAVNKTEQPVDFRAGLKGQGRLFHCNADLKIKRQLLTGRDGLVIGVYLHDTGRLFATSPQLFEVDCFDAHMKPVEVRLPQKRRYGNLVSDQKGGVLVGIHSGYGDPEGGYDDALGRGSLIRFDPDTGEARSYDVDVDGGRGGRHYVSSLAVTRDGRIAYYTSEAGKRLLRYDLEAEQQLPDLYVAGEGESLTYGLDVNSEGQVLLATGDGAVLFGQDGEIIRRFSDSLATGWTRASFAHDGRSFFFSNFLEGVLQRRDLETGDVLASLETGLSGAVTTTIEVASAQADLW